MRLEEDLLLTWLWRVVVLDCLEGLGVAIYEILASLKVKYYVCWLWKNIILGTE